MDTIRIEFPLKAKQKLTEEKAVQVMMQGLQKLIDFGALKGNLDDILQSYEFKDELGYALAVLKKEALVDASKLNSIGASYQFTQEVEPEEIMLTDKQFSVQSIEIRMREMKWAPKLRFANTIRDFRKYWKAKSSQMAKDPVLAKRVQNLFLLEISGIFAEILPYIEEGRQLAALTGLNVVTQGMTAAARDLSLAYRKALKASKTGQLSKNVYTGLRTQYNRFVSELIPQVFPGIEDILGSKGAEEGSKKFSEVGTGIITLVADRIEPWEGLITAIKGKLEAGESVNIKIGGEEFPFGENNKLTSFEANQYSETKAKQFSDGRVKIFSDTESKFGGYAALVKVPEYGDEPYTVQLGLKDYKDLNDARKHLEETSNYKYTRVKDRLVKDEDALVKLRDEWKKEADDLNAKFKASKKSFAPFRK